MNRKFFLMFGIAAMLTSVVLVCASCDNQTMEEPVMKEVAPAINPAYIQPEAYISPNETYTIDEIGVVYVYEGDKLMRILTADVMAMRDGNRMLAYRYTNTGYKLIYNGDALSQKSYDKTANLTRGSKKLVCWYVKDSVIIITQPYTAITFAGNFPNIRPKAEIDSTSIEAWAMKEYTSYRVAKREILEPQYDLLNVIAYKTYNDGILIQEDFYFADAHLQIIFGKKCILEIYKDEILRTVFDCDLLGEMPRRNFWVHSINFKKEVGNYTLTTNYDGKGHVYVNPHNENEPNEGIIPLPWEP